MSLPKYSNYKDSGIPWVGDVPAHWQVLPLIGVASERSEPNIGMREDNLLSLSYGRIVRKDIESNDGLLPESFETYQVIRDGDIVLRLTDLQNDKRSLRSALVSERGIITSAYLTLQPNRVDSRFLAYLLRGYDLSGVFYSMGGGLRQSMKFSDMKRMPVVLPSEVEQTAIVTFLDRKIGKIDALIAEQEVLIALLAEKRQATVSHAVTRGLNPDALMKDSGVAWLGNVPAHWGVSALSYLGSIETGSTPDRGEPLYWNGSIPWLKTGEINWAPIREAEEFITEAGLTNSAVKIARPGTLLMAMYGQGVTRGRVALLEIEATYNQACAAILFGPRINPEFGRYFFMAAYDHVRDAGNETSQMNLSAGLIAKIRLPVPPVHEQVAIVRLLDAETTKLDVLRAEAERAVALLKERRSALIVAAVTGQIDVRAASPQPAPLEELAA